MVSATTENSITWTWNAVEGAIGYGVQVSADHDFDDSDTIHATTETTHTESELEPETTVHVRVRAASGTVEEPVPGEWSEHVDGTSAMPPPVGPTPFMATFSVPEDADSPFPMVPDDGEDEMTAMATANAQMTVTVNMQAILTPTFLEDANSVVLIAGEMPNMPFEHVSWMALQSTVVTTGATFELQPVEMGANQIPVPIGDMHYVTCGPFACIDGMDAPEISIGDSAVCSDWEYDISLDVGFVDNTAMDSDGAATAYDDTRDDGIDVGWVYTSNTDMTVKHHFGGSLTVDGPTAKKKSLKTALGMTSTSATAPVSADDYAPALLFAANETVGTATGDDIYGSDFFGATLPSDVTAERWVCDSDGTADVSASDYASSNLSVAKPDGCFRVSTNRINYLADYSIELAAKGSSVSWGSVDWEESPFKDLTCDTVTVAAADEVDVCGLFEEEVDRALAAGWGGAEAYASTSYTSENVTTPTANVPSGATLSWEAESSSKRRQFATIWWDNDDDGDGADEDLYTDTADSGTPKVEPDPAVRDGLVLELLDSDGDPMYGDIGKHDRRRASADGETKNARPNADGKADNYSDGNAACSDDDGGDGCDAKVVIEKDVVFESGTAFECEVERTLKIECTWDAQGRMGLSGGTVNLHETGGDIENFLSCKVKM